MQTRMNPPPGRTLIAALLLTLMPVAAVGDPGAETERYTAELQLLRIEGSMFDIQSRAFAAATPDKRAKMWADLDIVRKELAKVELQELLNIRAQIDQAQ
jgi:hypothetical protein